VKIERLPIKLDPLKNPASPLRGGKEKGEAPKVQKEESGNYFFRRKKTKKTRRKNVRETEGSGVKPRIYPAKKTREGVSIKPQKPLHFDACFFRPASPRIEGHLHLKEEGEKGIVQPGEELKVKQSSTTQEILRGGNSA